MSTNIIDKPYKILPLSITDSTFLFAANEVTSVCIKNIWARWSWPRTGFKAPAYLYIGGYFWTGAIFSLNSVYGFSSKEEALIYRDKHFSWWLKNRFLLHKWSQL